jgi:acyl-CoA thioesterase-2
MSGFGLWQGTTIGEVVRVAPAGADSFRNVVAQRNSIGQLFGGQSVGLALQAASETVEGRPAHALTCYFLRMGSVDAPVDLLVERIFDGGSFSNRRVSVRQNGALLFQLQASFQRDECGVEHALPPPDVPGAESLMPIQAIVNQWRDRMPDGVANRLRLPPAIDLRPVDPAAYMVGTADQRARLAWVRVPSAAGLPDATQRSILAYLCDYWLAETAVLPHEEPGRQRLFLASLNQSTWFYRPFSLYDWLLVDCETAAAQSGRGIGRSRMFDRNGRLIGSAAQEALIRRRND